MKKAVKLSLGDLRPLIISGLVFVLFISQGLTVNARSNNTVSEVAVGISNIISPISPLGMDSSATEVIVASNMDKSSDASSASSSSEEEESRLVMANVSRVMNVM